MLGALCTLACMRLCYIVVPIFAASCVDVNTHLPSDDGRQSAAAGAMTCPEGGACSADDGVASCAIHHAIDGAAFVQRSLPGVDRRRITVPAATHGWQSATTSNSTGNHTIAHLSTIFLSSGATFRRLTTLVAQVAEQRSGSFLCTLLIFVGVVFCAASCCVCVQFLLPDEMLDDCGVSIRSLSTPFRHRLQHQQQQARVGQILASSSSTSRPGAHIGEIGSLPGSGNFDSSRPGSGSFPSRPAGELAGPRLCPNLIVPRGCECVLWQPSKLGKDGSMDILGAGLASALRARVYSPPYSPREGTLLALFSLQGETLALCSWPEEVVNENKWKVRVKRPSGSVFGTLRLTMGTASKCVRASVATTIGERLHFRATDLQRTSVTDDSGDLVAMTEPEVSGSTSLRDHLMLRIAPRADSGLILACMLCLRFTPAAIDLRLHGGSWF